MVRKDVVCVTAVAMLMVLMSSHSFADPVAYGGGCETVGGVRPCIAATGSSMPLTISADFYITSHSFATMSGEARMYICRAGSPCLYKSGAITAYLGHYPGGTAPTGTGSGQAYTLVDLSDANGEFVISMVSPVQYWDP